MNMYDMEKYRAALKKLKMNIQEMDNAMDGLFFEHGTGGISTRAETYADELDEQLVEALLNFDVVSAMILEESNNV
jgi:hypothetical protein